MFKGSKRGGKRLGAGRKRGSKSKKTIEQEKALEFLREEIRKHFPELIQNEIELARGIWVEQLVEIPTKKGKPKKFRARVYRKEPDIKAIENVLDRVVGKPKTSFELESGIPATVNINIISEEVTKAKKRIEEKNKNV